MYNRKDKFRSARVCFGGFKAKQWDWYTIQFHIRRSYGRFSWANLNAAIYKCAKKTGIEPSKIDGAVLSEYLSIERN